MHTKLDDLLLTTGQARNGLVGIEESEQAEIEELKGDIRAAINSAHADRERKTR